MKSKRISKKLDKIVEHYLRELDNYNDEQFNKVPRDGGWSLAQLYYHLVVSNPAFLIEKINEAMNTKGNENEQPKFIFRICQAIRMLPPIKVKLPNPNKSIPPSISIDEARVKLPVLLSKLKELIVKVENGDYAGKASHPFFGPLAPMEWLELAEMHLRHHLRQKARLDKHV